MNVLVIGKEDGSSLSKFCIFKYMRQGPCLGTFWQVPTTGKGKYLAKVSSLPT